MSAASFSTLSSTTGEAKPDDALVLGTDRRFGRYELCYELAAGGMGSVYLARAEGPHRFEKLVALKRIHPHLAKEDRFVEMFLDEARLAAQIHHPNVCAVMDFGEHEGSYYLTMPYVMGKSLHSVLRKLAREPEAAEGFELLAIRLVADACEGLHAAHELRDGAGALMEVVHRDVSPQNLLIGFDGGVRVLDFGVASARQRLYNTATGEVKGKFAYIAPEQVAGEEVDRRADVWSLGVVLFECLTRQRAFGKKTMAQTINAVMHQPLPSIRDHLPDISPRLEEIVFTALSRDADERYASARALGRDLLEYLADQRIAIGPADIVEWMESLFPTGLDEQRAMVEQAKSDAALDRLLPEHETLTETLPRSSRTEILSSGEIELEAASDEADEADPVQASGSGGASGARWRSVALAVGLLTLGVGGTVAVQQLYGEAAQPVVEPDPSTTGVGTPPSDGDAVEPGPAPAVVAEAAGDDADGEDAAGEDAADAVGDDAAPLAQTSPPAAEDSPGADPSDESGAEASPAGDTAQGAARSESAARAPRGPGVLRVATVGGWAIVFDGARRLGESPGEFTLPSGAHTIGVQWQGQGEITRHRVRVRAGRPTRLVVRR